MRSKLIILGCGSSVGVPRIDGFWGSCKKNNKSCGTQIADPNIKNVSQLFNDDYNFAILGSDLFALYNWTNNMNTIIKKLK